MNAELQTHKIQQVPQTISTRKRFTPKLREKKQSFSFSPHDEF